MQASGPVVETMLTRKRTTHVSNTLDGAQWVADVLQAQKEELDLLADWLGEETVSAARTAHRCQNYELAAQLITASREGRKMRKSELEQLQSSFKACVAQEILRYRTIVGAGQLTGFAGAISVHAVRYQSKLDGLSSQGVDTRSAEKAIKDFADSAVRAAFERGTVELESAGD
jgi:hypothetical protein